MQPQRPPAPKKKSANGCLIALAVVVGLAMITVAAMAFGVYRFSQSKEGKMIFGVIGDMTKLVAEAQSAPGAAEVRELGCDQGLVLDVDRMTRLFAFLDAAAPPSGQFSVMVVCQVGFSGAAPSCDDVARTYHAAAGAPARGYITTVSRGGSQGTVCSTLYAPSGAKVQDLDAQSAPVLPAKR